MYAPVALTPGQCRAARELLGWTTWRLSGRTTVSVPRLRQFEAGKRDLSPETLSALRAVLEAEGVTFERDDGSGRGVRLARNG